MYPNSSEYIVYNEVRFQTNPKTRKTVIVPAMTFGQRWKRALSRMIARFNQPKATMTAPAVPQISAQVHKIGATPAHYRAFSLIQPRIINYIDHEQDSHPALAAFRNKAKEIRTLNNEQISDAACGVLDTFVALVDAFVSLWDAVGKTENLRIFEVGQGARVQLRADMLATIAKLDAELQEILSSETVSHDKFNAVQRFVDMRYGQSKDSYGLNSI